VDDLKLWFHVRDSGSGIAADKLVGLFQPYKQADISIAGRHGGHWAGPDDLAPTGPVAGR